MTGRPSAYKDSDSYISPSNKTVQWTLNYVNDNTAFPANTISGFNAVSFGWSSTQSAVGTAVRAGTVQINYDINGNRYAELVIHSVGSAIYQDIATTPGAIYKWSIQECSYSSAFNDIITVMIGAPGKETAQSAYRSTVNGNGDKVGSVGTQISTKNSNANFDHNYSKQWETYTGTYIVPSGQTTTRFTFKSIKSGKADKGGNIDNISFQISYPLYYNLTNGTTTSNLAPTANNYSGYYTAGQSAKLTTVKPTRTGYTFLGWSATQLADSKNKLGYDTNKSKAITTIAMASPSKTVYAIWAKNPTITYKNSSNNTTVKTETLAPGGATTYPTVSIPTGCHIEWDKTVATAWEDTTISYSIVPNSYTINFNGNGAESGNVSSITAKYEDTIAIPNNGFERHGYYFTGWNTKADGTGTTYEVGQNVMKLVEGHTGAITLYAQWTPMKEELWIEAEADIDGYGSAIVSWPTYDYYNKNFKVYQQPDEADQNDPSAWQSIGIDYRDVKEVKCLQVYPIEEAKNQLKEWMETNGYGKGIIKIDEIDIASFNANPTQYLKDTDNNYRYDVIFFGTWDTNGKHTDISSTAADAVVDFINAGRSAIFGHDTIADNRKPNFMKCAEATGIYDSVMTEIDGKFVLTGKIFSGNENSPYAVPTQGESSSVQITKKGLMTNYPWLLGDIGTVLTIPSTHTSQSTNGNIWLRFALSSYTSEDMLDDGNFYLSTKNNCAMIQTGHSNGRATDDEQKILANLIFYMNQLVFNTSTLRDASAQDTTAPIFEEHAFDPATATLSLTPRDLGNTYRYKATSYTKDDTTENGKIVDSSNIAEANVTTGTRQVQYLIDDNPNTTLTKDATNNTVINANDNASLVIDYSPHRGRYLHAIAIDGAGNISETKTVYLPRLFTVTIKNGLTGDIIDTQQVEEGASVDESRYQLPEPQDWVFIGYDAPIDNIVSDMEITAIYEHIPIAMPETGTHNLAIMTIIGSVMFVIGISALVLKRKRKAAHSERHTISEERL